MSGRLARALPRGDPGRARRRAQHAPLLCARPAGLRAPSSPRAARDYAAAGRAEIEAYLVDQDARGMAQATRARRLSAIRQFYRFAFLEGWREDDPARADQGTEAGADAARQPQRGRGRPAARRGGPDRPHRSRPAARRLPDAAPLRDRPAGQRARLAAARGGARRPADDPRPRQGRARADGAAVAAGARRARRLARAPRRGRRKARSGRARPTSSRRAGAAAT